MEFKQDFTELPSDKVHEEAKARKESGWRYVQMLAVNKDEAVDIVYSYMKDGHLDNLIVSDLARDGELPSITDIYLEAFVCENEIHDLFGISFPGLAIDFKGNFYRLSTEKPMTIISPEQLAAREKAAKIEAAKAKKSADADKKDPAADMEAKLAEMDPEKAAKVRAAMEAKAKKEAAAKEKELNEKLAGMDPEKAAKVKAAMEAKAKKQQAQGGE